MHRSHSLKKKEINTLCKIWTSKRWFSAQWFIDVTFFNHNRFCCFFGTLLDPLGTLLDLLGTLLDPLGTLLDPLGTLLQYTGPYWTLLQYTGPVGYSTGTCCHLKSCSSSRDAFPNWFQQLIFVWGNNIGIRRLWMSFCQDVRILWLLHKIKLTRSVEKYQSRQNRNCKKIEQQNTAIAWVDIFLMLHTNTKFNQKCKFVQILPSQKHLAQDTRILFV